MNNYSTDNEKITALHNKIVNAAAYEKTERLTELSINANNVLGVIDEGTATAEAYARTFQLVLNYLGIENYTVRGKLSSAERHIWNLVRLDDDRYYYVDCAEDDAESTKKYLFAGSSAIADRELNSPEKSGYDHILPLPEASKDGFNGKFTAKELPEDFDNASFVKKCSSHYGYDQLGKMENGKNLQKLYNAMFDTAYDWWCREDNNGENYVVYDFEKFGIKDFTNEAMVVLCYFRRDNYSRKKR